MITVRIGTETDRQNLIERYPGTKQVIGNGGYLLLAETDDVTTDRHDTAVGQNDSIAGYLWAFKRQIPAPVEQNEIFINIIEVIDEKRRRQGLATMLLNEIKRLAKQENVYQLRAYCDIGNIPSHRLWMKNGFSVSPVKMPDGYIVGSYVSFVCR